MKENTYTLANTKYFSLPFYWLCFFTIMFFSGNAAAGDVFFEDFEGFAVDSYPTSFTQIYNGTGDANQKVM